jgi:large subunit ribosomal protein L17
MRHQKAGRKFGRNSSHRRAMMRNLVTSLLVHERVATTDSKAKELRRVAERLVSKATRVSELADESPSKLSQSDRARLLHARRVASKHVRSRATDRSNNEVDVLWKLFTVLGPRFVERPGGYTRIVKLPKPRKGDAAPMSIVEFVDYDDVFEAASAEEDGGEKKRGLLGNLFGGKKEEE